MDQSGHILGYTHYENRHFRYIIYEFNKKLHKVILINNKTFNYKN